MKRLLSLILVFIMVCSLLTACVDPPVADPDDDKKDPTTQTEEPAGPSVPTKDTALTVGDHAVSGIILHYFYLDAVTNFCNAFSQYGEYANTYLMLMTGLDVSKPLAQQTYDEETGETWADYFIDEAVNTAHWAYALYADSVANNFKLSDEEQAQMDSMEEMVALYASYAGFEKPEEYLQFVYGETADMETYTEYYNTAYIAQIYAQHNYDAPQFSHEDLLEYETSNNLQLHYNSYSYAHYYISTSQCLKFLFGTKETYTDEERSIAAQGAKTYAETVANASSSVDAMDLAIQWLEINENNLLASASQEKYALYNGIRNESVRNWLADADRKAGDVAVLENTSGDFVEGYYVVLFENVYENQEPLANVQHILLLAKTESERETALTKADEILAEFRSLPAQDSVSFGALAAKYTEDPGSKETGGLYENICRNQTYASNFEEWALAGHKAGDTGVITTEHGIHIMFYTGDGELTYREYMIDTDMRTEALDTWTEELLESTALTEVNIGCLDRDLVVIPQS